jgi:demethylmenaquinone methyltransferase/2-methoxy-6-polyprenyl-1,4-benzoquinol methylase
MVYMTSPSKENREAEWFGYKHIDPSEKTRLVESVFDSVASRYDLMNDLMSGGIHRIWKNRFVQLMQPRATKTLLDVAGGTGDIAFRYRERAGEAAKITVCDINKQMLRVGHDRAIDRGYINGFNWVEGNAEKLPFENSSFHLYSIAFGLRNVAHIDDALKQAHRVLKPGGQFFCLEFSHLKNDLLKRLYDEYSFRVVPKIGALVAKDRDSYQYLVESIRQFPKPEELSGRMMDAGFDKVQVVTLSGGIAAVHVGLKA